MDSNNNGTIRTHSNIIYNVLQPRSTDVLVADIAHGLSNLCRFSGQCKCFYSVAQHSLYVSYMLENNNSPRIMVLYGLLHDAAEAYCTDLPRPIKHSGLMEAYKLIEAANERAINERFGFNLTADQLASVKMVDKRVCATEQRELFRVKRDDTWVKDFQPYRWKIRALNPKVAEAMFLLRYKQLTGKLSIWDKLRMMRYNLI